MEYSEFLAWCAQGNVDEFYSSMRWTMWKEMSKNIKFDEGILIYPFLWSKEIQIETTQKKVFLFDELFNINQEYRRKFIV